MNRRGQSFVIPSTQWVSPAFDPVGITHIMGPRPFTFSAKGRDSEMVVPSGFDRVSTARTNSTPASPPTLAKNERMGHPQWEWCTQRSLKAGHLYNLVGVVKRHVECLRSAFPLSDAKLIFLFTY